jgi:hypothetical protein
MSTNYTGSTDVARSYGDTNSLDQQQITSKQKQLAYLTMATSRKRYENLYASPTDSMDMSHMI